MGPRVFADWVRISAEALMSPAAIVRVKATRSSIGAVMLRAIDAPSSDIETRVSPATIAIDRLTTALVFTIPEVGKTSVTNVSGCRSRREVAIR